MHNSCWSWQILIKLGFCVCYLCLFFLLGWNSAVFGHLAGWQYRWFTVDAQTGILRYFLPTNNWSSSSTNNIASESQSISSGHRSFDLDALSTTSAYNADSPTSNHIGSTPRWQVNFFGSNDKHMFITVTFSHGQNNRNFIFEKCFF